MSKNKMLMIDLLLNKVLLLNLSFIFFEQAKPRQDASWSIKTVWRGRQLRFGFHCYLKNCFRFSCTHRLRRLLTSCPLKAPLLRHAVWGAADGSV
jgi:Uri superfamily endonuclease